MITPYIVDNIYQGDCAELLKRLPCSCIDLTVTSPPYDNLRDYNGYTFDFKTIAKELFRVTADGGVVVWIVGDATIDGSETGTSFRQALFFMDIGFRQNDTMIWNKGSFTAVGALKTRYAQTFEFMFVLSKGKPKTFNPIKDRPNKSAGTKITGTIRKKDGTMKRMSNCGREIQKTGIRFNVWEQPPHMQRGEFCHPAPFPEKLAHDHILSWSNPGDLVLDPFMGSGTTAKMAHHCQRHYLGFEISQEYINIANERLRQKRLFAPGEDK